MALSINALCIGCQACLQVCPNQAVQLTAQGGCQISASTCTECVGDFVVEQCASICPVEGAIVDAQGLPLNPEGSLLGRFELQAIAYERFDAM